MPRERVNRKGEWVFDSDDSWDDSDIEDYYDDFNACGAGPSWGKRTLNLPKSVDAKYAKRMQKRRAARRVAINFLRNRSELVVKCWKTKQVYEAFREYTARFHLSKDTLKCGTRKHICKETLVTIIGPEEHRLGLMAAIEHKL